MIAVMLMGPALMLLVPYIDSLPPIVLLLSVAASMGWTASALNFALVTDLVRNPADIGKVTSITVLGGNLLRHHGTDRHRLCRGDDRQLQRDLLPSRARWRLRSDLHPDLDPPADRGRNGRTAADGVTFPTRSEGNLYVPVFNGRALEPDASTAGLQRLQRLALGLRRPDQA